MYAYAHICMHIYIHITFFVLQDYPLCVSNAVCYIHESEIWYRLWKECSFFLWRSKLLHWMWQLSLRRYAEDMKRCTVRSSSHRFKTSTSAVDQTHFQVSSLLSNPKTPGLSANSMQCISAWKFSNLQNFLMSVIMCNVAPASHRPLFLMSSICVTSSLTLKAYSLSALVSSATLRAFSYCFSRLQVLLLWLWFLKWLHHSFSWQVLLVGPFIKHLKHTISELLAPGLFILP